MNKKDLWSSVCTFFWVSLNLDLDIEVMFAFFVRSKVHSVQGSLSAFITNEVRLVLMWLTPQLWPIIKELFVACFHYRFVVSDIWIHQVPTFGLRIAWEDTWSNRMWTKPFILNPRNLSYIENTATKSTNLKMNLWNANTKILRQNERLKPSTTETALSKYFRVRNDVHFWEKPFDVFFSWYSGSWSNISSYQRAAGGGRGGGGEVGPPLLWRSCCHSCPQAWGRHSGWVRSQLDIIACVLVVFRWVVDRLTQLFYIWIFIC